MRRVVENQKPKLKQGDPHFGEENYNPTPPVEKHLTSGPNDDDWKKHLDPARVKRGDPIHRVNHVPETMTQRKKIGRPRKSE
jgi:hypothetical protein